MIDSGLPDLGATIYNTGISFTLRGLKRQYDLHGNSLERYLKAKRFPIGKTILIGLPKCLKSMIAQWSGLCFATRTKWFGEYIDSGIVVYLDLEEGYRKSQEGFFYTMYMPRLLAMAKSFASGGDLPIDNFHLWSPKEPIEGKAVLDTIDEAVKMLTPKLLVIDSLGVYLQGVRFEDYPSALTELDKHLTKIERTLLVAHAKSRNPDDNVPMISEQIWGGIKQGYWAQAIWNSERISDDDPSKVKLSFDERFGETKPLKLQVDDVTFTLTEISEQPEMEAKITDTLIKLLPVEQDSNELMASIKTKTGCSESYYRSIFAKLKRQGKIKEELNPDDRRKRIVTLMGGVPIEK